jgi:uncharacterized Ntn-hydrolase superfamily protein
VTYSIVARDTATGQMGVAVQSHFFAVGRIVCWGQGGVGVVATQSFVEPAYGPRGLALMAEGMSAADALRALVMADDEQDRRQVGMVDAAGVAAAHTGARCIPAAGQAVGDGFSVQANMMRNDTVWGAMRSAYEATTGDLAARLLAALDAAQAEGGDIRGRQSAALLIVPAERHGQGWPDRTFDVRVEDHPEPLAELRRLLDLHRAYDRLDQAEHALTDGDQEEAARGYAEAAAGLGANVEGTFWAGVALASSGDIDKARAMLAPALAAHDGWAELLRRLPAVDLLPAEPGLIERLLARTGG